MNKRISCTPMPVSVSLTNDMVGSPVTDQIILIDAVYVFVHNPGSVVNNISYHSLWI